jgi:uncharacterized protein YndB with AHSA1/START domain
MSNQHERNRVTWRIIILTLIGLLLTAGVGSLFSSFALKWLLILAPFVVGFLAAAGLVRMSDRRWPEAGARPRRLVVKWFQIPAAFVVGLVVVTGLVALVGALLPRPHNVTRSARYAVAPEKVWAIISDFETHHQWRPGLRSVRRLPDRNGHAVWNVVSSSQPGTPGEIEVFELELSAFIVWLHMPPGTALVAAETAGKDLDFEVEVYDPPRRMRIRILDDDVPFGGNWTWELSPEAGGCRVRITEQGYVEPAVLRYFARAGGYAVTMEEHLNALGQRLGEQTRIDP